MSADGEQGGVDVCIQADIEAAVGYLRDMEEYDRADRAAMSTTKRAGPLVLAFAAHRLAHAAPVTDTPEVVRKAVDLAYDLLMEVEQTTSNVWWVNVDDPEVAVSDTLDALEDACAALAKHPTSPEDAA